MQSALALAPALALALALALAGAAPLVLAVVLSAAGCGNDSPSPDTPDASGFVAQLSDFIGYQTWQVIDYTIGGVNPAIGSAHHGNDNAYSRTVSTNGKEDVGGVYPEGAIIVKETYTWNGDTRQFASMGGLFAMVKRGGGFNPTGGGWEWFALAADVSTILDRGGQEMMGGMCNFCHSGASGTAGEDFVFTHPADFAASEETFSNYSSWTQIDDAIGATPLLGTAHHGDDPTSERRIYRHQILGRPDAQLNGYPVGTAIVKEVWQSGALTQVAAMVKRGWSFNPTHSGWEWFMLDPSTHQISARGADLMSGACNACHAQAENPTNGIDYVFKHEDDPFNK